MVYSDHQRLELEKEFHYSRYITIRRKSELAQALNLTERQVRDVDRQKHFAKFSMWTRSFSQNVMTLFARR